jgi:hypothetical protein
MNDPLDGTLKDVIVNGQREDDVQARVSFNPLTQLHAGSPLFPPPQKVKVEMMEGHPEPLVKSEYAGKTVAPSSSPP